MLGHGWSHFCIGKYRGRRKKIGPGQRQGKDLDFLLLREEGRGSHSHDLVNSGKRDRISRPTSGQHGGGHFCLNYSTLILKLGDIRKKNKIKFKRPRAIFNVYFFWREAGWGPEPSAQGWQIQHSSYQGSVPIHSASWRPGRLFHGFENGNPHIGSGNQIPLCKHTRSTWIGQKDSKEPTGLFWADNVDQNWKLARMDRNLKEIPTTMTILWGKCALPSVVCNIDTR